MTGNREPGTLRRRTVLTGFATAAVASTMSGGAVIATPQPAAVPAAAQIAPSGAWCWFGDPRAVHRRGRTFVGYITSTGEIGLTQYDHRTQVFSSSTLISEFQIDDHNNPSILIRPDGHLLVFWSPHGGDPMYYRRSVTKLDIRGGWEELKTVPTNVAGDHGYTYPNPVQLAAENNRVYLFWRGGDFNPTWSVTDDEDTWSTARTLITVPGERPYVKVASNDVDTIHFAFTDGHPRNVDNSIYYMYYREGSLYKADGTRIGPLSKAVTPQMATKVYDVASGNGKAWIHDIADDGRGRPVITYAVFPTDADHRYRYARWTGTEWFDTEIVSAGDSISEDTSEPNYSGGITLDHTNPAFVLLSREINGVNEIERWQALDGGRRWRVRSVTTNSTEPQVRPFSPRGRPSAAPLRVFWMAGRYPSYTTYQTRIMGS